jgi:hypothetical protein
LALVEKGAAAELAVPDTLKAARWRGHKSPGQTGHNTGRNQPPVQQPRSNRRTPALLVDAELSQAAVVTSRTAAKSTFSVHVAS